MEVIIDYLSVSKVRHAVLFVKVLMNAGGVI